MTAERILQSDVLDILFEDRNKSYGAYNLRRTYPRRVKLAIGGMFLLVAIGSASYLFGSGRSTENNVVYEITDTTKLAILTPPEEEKPKEEAPPPAASQPDVATVKDFIPVIKPDIEVPITEVPETAQVDTSAYGNETHAGDAAQGQIVNSGPGDGSGTSNTDEGTAPAASEPVMPTGPIDMHQADEMPEYPGGSQALVRYMVNNLTSELEPGVKYVIRAQFVIDEGGKVSEATILSSDDGNLNNQVLKALRKMKQWKPGKLHGKNVSVRFTIPVTFMGPEE